MAMCVATVRWQLKLWVNIAIFEHSLVRLLGVEALETIIKTNRKNKNWIVSIHTHWLQDLKLLFLDYFPTVLPLIWEQDVHVNGDGLNLVVLLSSNLKSEVSLSAATETVSITIFSSSEATKNWYDVRHEELQSAGQRSSQSG